MEVVKRSGETVPFDKSKIAEAIQRASDSVSDTKKRITRDVVDTITMRLYGRYRKREEPLTVEDIQDDVETELMREGAFEVAKAYVKYRHTRNLVRSRYSDLMDAVNKKISGQMIENQNANVDEKSFGGRVGETSSLLLKRFALENCMTEKTRRNHLENRIYIHDLDHWALGDHNCLSVPFDDLLAKGFKIRNCDIRPAGSVGSALQLVAVVFQLQSLCQFGLPI